MDYIKYKQFLENYNQEDEKQRELINIHKEKEFTINEKKEKLIKIKDEYDKKYSSYNDKINIIKNYNLKAIQQREEINKKIEELNNKVKENNEIDFYKQETLYQKNLYDIDKNIEEYNLKLNKYDKELKELDSIYDINKIDIEYNQLIEEEQNFINDKTISFSGCLNKYEEMEIKTKEYERELYESKKKLEDELSSLMLEKQFYESQLDKDPNEQLILLNNKAKEQEILLRQQINEIESFKNSIETIKDEINNNIDYLLSESTFNYKNDIVITEFQNNINSMINDAINQNNEYNTVRNSNLNKTFYTDYSTTNLNEKNNTLFVGSIEKIKYNNSFEKALSNKFESFIGFFDNNNKLITNINKVTVQNTKGNDIEVYVDENNKVLNNSVKVYDAKINKPITNNDLYIKDVVLTDKKGISSLVKQVQTKSGIKVDVKNDYDYETTSKTFDTIHKIDNEHLIQSIALGNGKIKQVITDYNNNVIGIYRKAKAEDGNTGLMKNVSMNEFIEPVKIKTINQNGNTIKVLVNEKGNIIGDKKTMYSLAKEKSTFDVKNDTNPLDLLNRIKTKKNIGIEEYIQIAYSVAYGEVEKSFYQTDLVRFHKMINPYFKQVLKLGSTKHLKASLKDEITKINLRDDTDFIDYLKNNNIKSQFVKETINPDGTKKYDFLIKKGKDVTTHKHELERILNNDQTLKYILNNKNIAKISNKEIKQIIKNNSNLNTDIKNLLNRYMDFKKYNTTVSKIMRTADKLGIAKLGIKELTKDSEEVENAIKVKSYFKASLNATKKIYSLGKTITKTGAKVGKKIVGSTPVQFIYSHTLESPVNNINGFGTSVKTATKAKINKVESKINKKVVAPTKTKASELHKTISAGITSFNDTIIKLPVFKQINRFTEKLGAGLKIGATGVKKGIKFGKNVINKVTKIVFAPINLINFIMNKVKKYVIIVLGAIFIISIISSIAIKLLTNSTAVVASLFDEPQTITSPYTAKSNNQTTLDIAFEFYNQALNQHCKDNKIGAEKDSIYYESAKVINDYIIKNKKDFTLGEVATMYILSWEQVVQEEMNTVDNGHPTITDMFGKPFSEYNTFTSVQKNYYYQIRNNKKITDKNSKETFAYETVANSNKQAPNADNIKEILTMSAIDLEQNNASDIGTQSNFILYIFNLWKISHSNNLDCARIRTLQYNYKLKQENYGNVKWYDKLFNVDNVEISYIDKNITKLGWYMGEDWLWNSNKKISSNNTNIPNTKTSNDEFDLFKVSETRKACKNLSTCNNIYKCQDVYKQEKVINDTVNKKTTTYISYKRINEIMGNSSGSEGTCWKWCNADIKQLISIGMNKEASTKTKNSKTGIVWTSNRLMFNNKEFNIGIVNFSTMKKSGIVMNNGDETYVLLDTFNDENNKNVINSSTTYKYNKKNYKYINNFNIEYKKLTTDIIEKVFSGNKTSSWGLYIYEENVENGKSINNLIQTDSIFVIRNNMFGKQFIHSSSSEISMKNYYYDKDTRTFYEDETNLPKYQYEFADNGIQGKSTFTESKSNINGTGKIYVQKLNTKNNKYEYLSNNKGYSYEVYKENKISRMRIYNNSTNTSSEMTIRNIMNIDKKMVTTPITKTTDFLGTNIIGSVQVNKRTRLYTYKDNLCTTGSVFNFTINNNKFKNNSLNTLFNIQKDFELSTLNSSFSNGYVVKTDLFSKKSDNVKVGKKYIDNLKLTVNSTNFNISYDRYNVSKISTAITNTTKGKTEKNTIEKTEKTKISQTYKYTIEDNPYIYLYNEKSSNQYMDGTITFNQKKNNTVLNQLTFTDDSDYLLQDTTVYNFVPTEITSTANYQFTKSNKWDERVLYRDFSLCKGHCGHHPQALCKRTISTLYPLLDINSNTIDLAVNAKISNNKYYYTLFDIDEGLNDYIYPAHLNMGDNVPILLGYPIGYNNRTWNQQSLVGLDIKKADVIQLAQVDKIRWYQELYAVDWNYYYNFNIKEVTEYYNKTFSKDVKKKINDKIKLIQKSRK